MTTVKDQDRSNDVGSAGSEASAIDTEAVDDLVTHALAITLAMPERSEIDRTTRQLCRALNQLVAGDPELAPDPATRQMYRQAHRLLELNARPTAETPQFTAYTYMRDLSDLTRRFLVLHSRHSLPAERHPEGGSDA
ncbi:hypothetical protein [Streptomyces sp. ITFR-16]|uniref:hypothetical protein n=1 Tax=Streptomyces sp. ITFR-16 TaxID=3075198 RepID=UPI00288ABA80|nr:hypothetical protein [Streptomyces sp. ITFR-16]WNI23852.1 hypothetical protein RLT58_18885 [Streptomyces sp. ITFR-16]